jgi:hypothetical protein
VKKRVGGKMSVTKRIGNKKRYWQIKRIGTKHMYLDKHICQQNVHVLYWQTKRIREQNVSTDKALKQM